MPDHHRRCKARRGGNVTPPHPPRLAIPKEQYFQSDETFEDTASAQSGEFVRAVVTEDSYAQFDQIGMDENSTLVAELDDWLQQSNESINTDVNIQTVEDEVKTCEDESNMWLEVSEMFAENNEVPSLVRARYYWNDLGVRLELRLPIIPQEGITKEQWLLFLRPRHDFIKISLPRVDWIVHDFYHASLQQVHHDSTNTELILEFIPFNPKDVFFERLSDLPVPEITGSAHYVSTNPTSPPLSCAERLASKMSITFYRHPEAEDRDRILLAIQDMMRRMDMPSLFDDSQNAPKAKRTRTEYLGNQNFMWLGARFRYERALIKLVQKFIATSRPPLSTLLQLEAMAKECGCFYVLHVLVDARLGNIVRKLTQKRACFDQLAENVLDFLGCDFNAARAWAIHRIQTAVRERSNTTSKTTPKISPLKKLFATSASEENIHTTDHHSRRCTEPAAKLMAQLANIDLNAKELENIYEDTDEDNNVSLDEGQNVISKRSRRLSAPSNPNMLRQRSLIRAQKEVEDIDLVVYRQKSSRDSFSKQNDPSIYDTDGKYDALAERCARKWIEQVTGIEFHKPFLEELSDGKLLCILANKIKLNSLDLDQLSIPRVRLDAFLTLLHDEFRLPPEHLFQSDDLLNNETKDSQTQQYSANAVVHCIFALAEKTKQLRSDLPTLKDISMNNDFLAVVYDDDAKQQQPIHDAEHKTKKSLRQRINFSSFLHYKTRKSRSPGPKDKHDAHRLKLQNNGISVIQYASETPESAFLTIWSAANHRYHTKEKQLCKILQAKHKRFELVYIDITPERKHNLDAICDKEIQLPVLTAGPELLGHADEILSLDANKNLDPLIFLAEKGDGFWLMPKPDDWQTKSPHSNHAHPDISSSTASG
eukprot:CAMPEP_0197314200 /NCGR_PEP_ID=MMETSP0891-20130614/32626_1 /TAXON_ID=44058 ORGANISM="Aureoumbra lagunensis, Strain CCMP1510" /NCGR_SAMPLE_ID=MMETSP0891 /ASSEMBLY_ACC=CAM_ASM_000534 /LENGTH=878 /DNA_ID=CAMNT_0042802513 /DNA_START=197 /DNA_END=2833 /DNA_ORIENTATION=-